jgi:hypothetical protein
MSAYGTILCVCAILGVGAQAVGADGYWGDAGREVDAGGGGWE